MSTPDLPIFENWAQYTRDARTFIPTALDYTDEAPWSQETLGSMLGVTGNYVAIIERGEKEPGLPFKMHLRHLLIMAQHGIDPRMA